MPPIKLSDLNNLRLAPGIDAKIITADTMTVTHVRIKAGSPLPEHTHVHEQVVNLIEGEMEIVVDGRPHRMTAGSVFVLASNIPHSVRAVTDCYVVDVFHPVREDFRGTSFAGYDGTSAGEQS